MVKTSRIQPFGLIFFISAAVLLPALLSCNDSSNVPSEEQFEAAGLVPIRNPATVPDIQFLDGKGELHKISDYRGKVVLLNFWASWCPPCRAEMPSMSELASSLENRNFVMLPLNVQEEQALVTAFIREYDIDFPVFYDPEGRAAQEIGVSGLPTSLLIDKDGKALAAVTGALEWNSETIVDVLREWSR